MDSVLVQSGLAMESVILEKHPAKENVNGTHGGHVEKYVLLTYCIHVTVSVLKEDLCVRCLIDAYQVTTNVINVIIIQTNGYAMKNV